MADPVLTDVKSIEWKGIALMAQVLEWTDNRPRRVAVHEFPKVDGGRTEDLGRKPSRIRLLLVYTGPNWRKDHLVLLSSIDADPKGSLTHPLYGAMNVHCMGPTDMKVVPGEALDTITFSVEFVEDNINTKLDKEQSQQGVAAKQQKINTNSAAFSAAAAKFSAPSTAAATAGMASAATSYASAGGAAALGNVADPTLAQKLDSVGTSVVAAVAALRSDPAAAPGILPGAPGAAAAADIAVFEALNQAEQVFGACQELAAAAAARRPQIISYTVPGATTIGVLAATLYGRDGRGRIDEILTNNRIPNPALIPGGTVLLVAAPTV